MPFCIQYILAAQEKKQKLLGSYKLENTVGAIL